MEKAAEISLPPELRLGKLCRSVPHHGRARTSQGDKLNIIGNGAVFLFSSSKTGGLCVLRSQEWLCHAEGIVPAAPASGRYQTWEISAQLIRGWQHSAEPPDGKRQESSSRSAGAPAELCSQPWKAGTALTAPIWAAQNSWIFTALFHSFFCPFSLPPFLALTAAWLGWDDKSSCSICWELIRQEQIRLRCCSCWPGKDGCLGLGLGLCPL